ncbi:MAG: hypothetical protein ACYTF6_04950 [Planctomycetota bacterium]|jgi:hypothetical protein
MSLNEAEKRRDWKYCLWLVLILSALYGVLQNGYWAPVSDGDYYVPVARNLARGQGYRFNGAPVVIVPPGWPLVLAAAMKLVPRFWFLNLLPMIFSVAAAGLWYWVLRRFASPRRSFVAILTSGVLFWWYHLTVVLHSEALFSLLLGGAALLAFQINENKPLSWRIPLLFVLCVAMPLVRWVGWLAWLIVGAALLSGQLKPKLNRQWICFGLSTLIIVATFVSVRFALTTALPGRPSGGPSAPSSPTAPSGVLSTLPACGIVGCFRRFADSGRWLSSLFWMPLQVGLSWVPLAVLANIVGWVLILLYVLAAVSALGKRCWIWTGVILYSGALCIRWEWPNARYLISPAPLLVFGVWSGIERLRTLSGSRAWNKTSKVISYVFLASVLVCNLALWGVDLWIARSRNFYANYYAGQAKGLIAAAHYLNQRSLGDGQLAVNERYRNIRRNRVNGFGMNSMNMLTGRIVHYVPQDVCDGRPNDELLRWARQRGVRYYLYRPPLSPWRVWHFRTPRLQKWVTGEPIVTANPWWELYELEGKAAVRVKLPKVYDLPLQIPGL